MTSEMTAGGGETIIIEKKDKQQGEWNLRKRVWKITYRGDEQEKDSLERECDVPTSHPRLHGCGECKGERAKVEINEKREKIIAKAGT